MVNTHIPLYETTSVFLVTAHLTVAYVTDTDIGLQLGIGHHWINVKFRPSSYSF